MYHIVYRITNIKNGKTYVGKHSTEDLNDGYMGSGTLLRKAIAKHGLESFRKEVIQTCKSEDVALDLERSLVTEDIVSDPNTYNLCEGGRGGNNWQYVNQNHSIIRRRTAKLRKLWSDDDFRNRRSSEISENNRMSHKMGKMKAPDWTGKHHTRETKLAIGRSNSVKQRGERNSQFGTVWIHNGKGTSRKVQKEELQAWLDRGWIKGRKMK